ncbi:MAG: tetratricopeptide repeat protein [Actinomycetota bacterium]|nr:tetratricopeptide repeat protein [Actinomycetota bacterium]
MTKTNVLDVTEQTFVQEVVERSHEVPVVVDFWASWCGPCRALGPLLERLAGEADGSWVLAKVDVDANPGLASGFGVQGIPAVRAWRDGKEVAEFVGALPEPQVRQWLGQLGPSAADVELELAGAALQRGDEDEAEIHLRKALDLEPAHAEARAALERLRLDKRAGGLDEAGARERLTQDPADVQAAIDLADVLAARDEMDEAFEMLVGAVRDSSGDERERVRSHLLALLDTISPDDPRAMRARRSLSLVLF